MLTRDSRDPAALPRLLLTAVALALLWPGIQLAELDLGVLLAADSQSEMGRFVAAFWPPAHAPDFLRLLLDATLQTLAIATAGMALALVVAIPTGLLASRALSLSAASRGGRPGVLGQALRWPVRALLIVLRSVPEIVWALLFVRAVGLGPSPGRHPDPGHAVTGAGGGRAEWLGAPALGKSVTLLHTVGGWSCCTCSRSTGSPGCRASRSRMSSNIRSYSS